MKKKDMKKVMALARLSRGKPMKLRSRSYRLRSNSEHEILVKLVGSHTPSLRGRRTQQDGDTQLKEGFATVMPRASRFYRTTSYPKIQRWLPQGYAIIRKWRDARFGHSSRVARSIRWAIQQAAHRVPSLPGHT